MRDLVEATSTLTNFRILLWIILIVITIIIVIIIIIIIVPPSSSWRSPKIHACPSVRPSKTALLESAYHFLKIWHNDT